MSNESRAITATRPVLVVSDLAAAIVFYERKVFRLTDPDGNILTFGERSHD
jgi:hypothetical protein